MNICPCCKTSHDSTACPTPSGKGLDETPSSRLRIPRHLLELRIRNAIADKEMVTAMANRDLQCGDGWRCDYAEWHREVSKEIEELFILSANASIQP